MLYLRLKSSFLMMLSLQWNGQKEKAVRTVKKEVLRVFREQLLGQREAEAAKQAGLKYVRPLNLTGVSLSLSVVSR